MSVLLLGINDTILTYRRNAAPGISFLLFGSFWQQHTCHPSALSAPLRTPSRTSRPSSAEWWTSSVQRLSEKCPRQIFVGHSRRELPTWQSARLECAGVRKRAIVCRNLYHRRFTTRTVLLRLIACYATKYFACYPNSDRRRRRPKC